VNTTSIKLELVEEEEGKPAHVKGEQLMEVLSNEAGIPLTDILELVPMSDPVMGEKDHPTLGRRVLTRTWAAQLRSRTTVIKVLQARRKLRKKNFFASEKLPEELEALKQRRMFAFHELKNRVGTRVHWREADLWVNTTFVLDPDGRKDDEGNTILQHRGYWELFTDYNSITRRGPAPPTPRRPMEVDAAAGSRSEHGGANGSAVRANGADRSNAGSSTDGGGGNGSASGGKDGARGGRS